jgi:hypothetical protein
MLISGKLRSGSPPPTDTEENPRAHPPGCNPLGRCVEHPSAQDRSQFGEVTPAEICTAGPTSSIGRASATRRPSIVKTICSQLRTATTRTGQRDSIRSLRIANVRATSGSLAGDTRTRSIVDLAELLSGEEAHPGKATPRAPTPANCRNVLRSSRSLSSLPPGGFMAPTSVPEPPRCRHPDSPASTR